MLSEKQKADWNQKGFFIIEGFANPTVGNAMEQDIFGALRSSNPEQHTDAPFYFIDKMLVAFEGQADMNAAAPEDKISKIFNTHLHGPCREFAHSDKAADIVADLLGPNIDVFQSQYIFKNPGAWGQPWHQDSHYFTFNQQPQVGLWLAISEATLENGCLAVIPGSHKLPILNHTPDSRPDANYGYLEIDESDFKAKNAEPVLMNPGDLLVFHSFLVHRSFDNQSKARRQAMVYHYGRAGTKAVDGSSANLSVVNHWVPVRRA
ncbi:MAG: phytanoyl-CoA dioxygenase family protein [Alphaproteobacteria bacterium]